MGKKILAFLILFMIVALSFVSDASQAAKKSGKKGGIKAEEIQAMSDTLDGLTKKSICTFSFFSARQSKND